MNPFIKGQRQWQSEVVVIFLDDRSYDIPTENEGTVRRNRAFLKATRSINDEPGTSNNEHGKAQYIPTTAGVMHGLPPDQQAPMSSSPAAPIMAAKPKRASKPPTKLEGHIIRK